MDSRIKQAVFGLAFVAVSGCAATQINQTGDLGFEPIPGLYATGDGTTEYSRTRLNADGTYVDFGDDGPTGEGTWYSKANEMCFDPKGEAENQQERCWTNGPVDENGRFRSTRTDNGQSYFIRRVSD